MTPQEIKEKRIKFAEACEELAKQAKKVPSGGWDTPPTYIADMLTQWAQCYRH